MNTIATFNALKTISKSGVTGDDNLPYLDSDKDRVISLITGQVNELVSALRNKNIAGAPTSMIQDALTESQESQPRM